MPGAVIVANQATGAGAGTPGVARNDLWQNQQVNLVVGTSGNSSVEWALLDKPVGSSASLTNASQSGGGPYADCTFTPDLVGTYRIQLVTNGGGPGNVQILVLRVRYDNTGVLTHRGWAIPAKGEVDGESNYGSNLKGWSEPLEFIFEDIFSSLAGSLPSTPLATPNTIAARGASAESAFGNLTTTKAITPEVASTGAVAIRPATGNPTSFFDALTELVRIQLAGSVRALDFQGAAAARIVSGGDLSFQCASGSKVSIKENATGIIDLSDESTVATLAGQGAGGTELSSSTGDLRFKCPTGSKISFKENATGIVDLSDESTISTLAGQGSGGTELSSATNNLVLKCPSGSKVSIKENTTGVIDLSDESTVATLAGQGAGGTELSSATGDLKLKCPSGAKVTVSEGSTLVVEISDSSNVALLEGKGSSGTRVKSSTNDLEFDTPTSKDFVFKINGTEVFRGGRIIANPLSADGTLAAYKRNRITGGTTFTLPAANSVPDGVAVVVKKVSYSTAITINPAGSDTIDGAASYSVLDSSLPNGNATFISDGTSRWDAFPPA